MDGIGGWIPIPNVASFGLMDAKAIRLALENDGFFIVKAAVSVPMCEAVLDAIRDDLGISVEDPDTWAGVSAQLDQVPIWGHQSQWDIRQLASLHSLFSEVWGTHRLWADRNSCRFTPPRRPGGANPLPIHWDVDPRDRQQLWYQGALALTDTPLGGGGFRCVPALMYNRDRWPQTWTATDYGTEYCPVEVPHDEIVEVPVDVGDLIIWSSRLPHGTVKNSTVRPRVVFYVQMFPEGTAEEAAVRVSEHHEGVAPTWWRWKPGHDRSEPWPPAQLSEHGKRLLGIDGWP